ncbi:ATP-binding protein [Roseivirga sp. BDSF3-8]|uniref:sensor histidine kinase n=1 Tax=Roseivirga sp. BDSF3-8 TaxID=3241598 RepID=UPI00353198CA
MKTDLLAKTDDLPKELVSFRWKGMSLPIVHLPEWTIDTKDGSYSFRAYLVDNDILLIKDSGYITPQLARQAVVIFEKIIEYSGQKKLYFLADLSELKSMPRSARKVLKEADDKLQKYWHHYFFIYNRVIRTVYRIYKTFYSNALRNSTISNNLSEALNNCLALKEQSSTQPLTVKPGKPEHKDYEKLSRDELINLLLQSEQEKEVIREKQQVHLEQIFKAISRISWDDQFVPEVLELSDDGDPFQPMFQAITILQQDISEMVGELRELNRNLEEKVTERTLEIAKKEANLLSLIENTKDFIFSLDGEFHLIIANKSYTDHIRKQFGCELRPGVDMMEVFSKELVSFWKPLYNRAFTGEVFSQVVQRKINGKLSVLESFFNPIKDTAGNISGVSVFVKDITEQKLNEKRLLEQNKELKKVNEELDRFVYSASHDLRAPLLSLLGLINIARMDEDIARRTDYLDMMDSSVKKLDKFIGEIIDYSRNTRLNLSRDSIDFSELVEEIVKELQFVDHSNAVKKTFSVDQEGDFICDRMRIKVSLTNIIYNAIRYSDQNKAEPYVHIAVKADENLARVKIEDNGQGIQSKHQAKIFDMFYRANENTSGSGLGLYIVKETVNKLKGKLSLDSEYKKGTTFSLEVPSVKES